MLFVNWNRIDRIRIVLFLNFFLERLIYFSRFNFRLSKWQVAAIENTPAKTTNFIFIIVN